MTAPDRERERRDQLILPVSFAVLLAWLVSLGIAALTAQYAALTITTPVMLVLAGYVFGVGMVKKVNE